MAYARPAPVVYTVGCYGTPGYVVGGSSCHGFGGCSGCWSAWSTPSYSCFGSGCGGCTGFGTIPYLVSPLTGCDCISGVTTPATSPAPSDGKANIRIELPADAKLIVDGQVVPGSGATRSFATPSLTAGKSFVYEMKAEMIVNGSAVQEDLKIVVHAGDQVEKSFDRLIAAAKRETPTELAKK